MTYTQAKAQMVRGKKVHREDVVLFLRRGTSGSPQATIWREIPDGEPVLFEPTPEELAARDWEVVS